MNKLVFVDNNRLVTDSLTVADTFGKRHADVLRSIENLDCSKEFNERNFASVEYRDGKGEMRPKYLLTQDGFSFLVMGYTGKEAARFKEMYINEFNRMRDELTKPAFALPQTFPEALRMLAAEMEQKAMIVAEKQQLEQKAEMDKPKVLFADSVSESKDSILIGDLAKILRQNGVMIGGTRFFNWLRENGYLIKSGSDYNMPTQRSMEMGLFEIKMGTRNGSDGTIKTTRTTKVTGKGQIYFLNKFKGTPQAS